LYAKHVKKKAIKWAKDKRPKKTRPSDINRKPIIYEVHSMVKPPEYTILDDPAVEVGKFERNETPFDDQSEFPAETIQQNMNGLIEPALK